MANVHEILNTWQGKGELEDWYALDEIKADGTMLRVTVGTFEDVHAMADLLMFGGDDAGCFANEPFYRFKMVSPEAARMFFEACAAIDSPSYASQLMTVREVAERTDRTRQAVLQLIQRGRLEAEMVMGEWRVMGWAVYSFKPYSR